jgi:NAD(P)-dependent dehydrogenase (short-subunit alcohol dehydrogenase family)
VVSVLSVLTWLHVPRFGAYSAGKTAAWVMTNVLREELRPRGIHVAALHVGYIDTDMAAEVPSENKLAPATVAKAGLDGIAAGAAEILVDDITRRAKQNLSVAI